MMRQISIHVIFTGGTISGVIEGDSIRPEGNLAERLGLGDREDLCFNFEEPYRILSENLDAGHLLQLRDCVAGAADKCDGIIITHGTDTLNYTAALLKHIFSGIDIPVVLVSAAYVLSDERSNAKANMDAAVAYIRDGGAPGVYVSYKNPGSGERALIIPGDRLLSPMIGSPCFFALETGSKGRLSAGCGAVSLEKLIYDEDLFRDIPVGQIRLSEKSDMILRLAAYPGMCFNSDLVTDRTGVVMLEGYHSGTIGVTEDLKSFVAYCRERKIPVLLSFLNSQEYEYETVDAYRKAGIIPVYDIPPVALYCRLWLIFSNYTEI